jgi:hypothetical protein
MPLTNTSRTAWEIEAMHRTLNLSTLSIVMLSLGLYAVSAHATLISHYTFDDAANLGADATGTNNGTPMGDATQGPGKVGTGALVLDGDDDYVNVGGTDSFNSVADDGDGWTVAAWVKIGTNAAPATGDNTMRLFSTYYEDGVAWTGTGWGLGNDRRNGDLLMSTTYGIIDMWLDPSPPTPDNEWTHWAYVYRNNGGAIATDYYIDGVLAGSSTPTNEFLINKTDQDYAIGSLGLDTYPQDFNGTIDDLRIYDTELTAEEIAELVSPSEVLLGDVNLDDVVNGLDVDPFVDVLLNGPFQEEADMNTDGVVNGLDVDPFVAAVVGGGVQAVPEPSTLLLLSLGAFIGLAWRR